MDLRDFNKPDRLLMQVDPEGLPIEAYPKRVIESLGTALPRGGPGSKCRARIDCTAELSQIRTWRFSSSRISSIQPSSDRLMFGGVTRYVAKAIYDEDVNGVLEQRPDGAFDAIGIGRVRTHFRTEAVIMEFTNRFEQHQMVFAAAVLRHLLAVHMAVDEDAMQVVPVFDDRPKLALVDLYPGGIGVVNAIHKSVWLVPMLFDQAALWLTSLGRVEAQAELSASPLVRTMGIEELDAKEALKVFQSATWQ